MAVDAGMDSGAADVFEAMKELALLPEQLKSVPLTHWHNNHAAGAAELKSRLGVSVNYAGEDAPFFTRANRRPGPSRVAR